MSNIIDIIEPEPVTSTALAATPATTPAALLAMAVQQGADLDKLERLMALQERWEASEARKAYNAAFSAFKAEAVQIFKNKKVDAGPLAGKTYAELHAVVNAVTPALSRHGLSAAWRLTKDDKDWIEITCTLSHIGGHSESVAMGGPPDAGGAKNAIQARASAVSYLSRYTLKAILGLSEQDDDTDGRAANEAQNSLAEARVEELIAQATAATTRAAAMQLWSEHNASLTALPKQHARLKKAVSDRCKALQEIGK